MSYQFDGLATGLSGSASGARLPGLLPSAGSSYSGNTGREPDLLPPPVFRLQGEAKSLFPTCHDTAALADVPLIAYALIAVTGMIASSHLASSSKKAADLIMPVFGLLQ